MPLAEARKIVHDFLIATPEVRARLERVGHQRARKLQRSGADGMRSLDTALAEAAVRGEISIVRLRPMPLTGGRSSGRFGRPRVSGAERARACPEGPLALTSGTRRLRDAPSARTRSARARSEGSGFENRKPCAVWQFRSRSFCACSSVSTPSAMTSIPSTLLRLMSASMMRRLRE